MYYIIIRYSNQCFAEQSYLFSSLFSLIFYLETTILEKREERKEKSEKNKKKRQPSVENCRFFLVQAKGLEPSRRGHQILSLARLPIPPRLRKTYFTIRLPLCQAISPHRSLSYLYLHISIFLHKNYFFKVKNVV